MAVVFGTDPHLERAKEHVTSNNDDRLTYACLELRLAIERIAYQKLQLRLDKVAFEEIGAWQPKRVMDRLMELVDERLDIGATISIAGKTDTGEPPDYHEIGTSKGVSPKEMGKHWQKLSSFLHVEMPKKKGKVTPQSPDGTKLRPYLQEVIAYVERLTSTNFDTYFSRNTTFTCGQCKQSITRNYKLLKEGMIVECQNPQCIASYVTHIEGDDFSFKTYTLEVACVPCKEALHYDANVFLTMKRGESKRYECPKCRTAHVVQWRLY